MLSKDLQRTLKQAVTYAIKQNHEYLSIEHLTLALLDNSIACEVLIACNANIEKLKGELAEYLDTHTPTFPESDSAKMPEPTEGFDAAVQEAIFHVQAADLPDSHRVTGGDLLVAVFSAEDTFALYCLNNQGITRADVVEYISHGAPQQDNENSEVSEASSSSNTASNALAKFTVNLNEKARKGTTDPLIGRSLEVERAAQILCRRKKNNPLLVGEPGVGKTAIAEGLAWLITQGQAPMPLLDATIYALDIGSLLAGAKYRGDFEKRLQALLKALQKQDNAILFIDEIHMLIGAGATQHGNSMDASNLLKPALANGSLRCIGATTFKEHRTVFEKDAALSRRFQKIDVEEPSIQDAINILRGLKNHYEDFHNVSYTDEAIINAVELSAKHMHERFLPDKAIDVIDEAGAFERLHERTATSKEELLEEVNKTIDVEQIESVIAKLARIPEKSITKDDKAQLKTLTKDLQRVVFGQDQAISSTVDAIMLARAGLKTAGKPIGSFMFAGPTGVGKTEVAKQLATHLGIEFARFDMSEYMEAHTVARLIGSPPGYVGHEQGGLLTEKIQQTPHCVLLLDEIEKAHPDIFNLLLQVMDYGSLTDSNGRKVSFANVVLIMTTNVGASTLSKTNMGFTTQTHSSDSNKAMERVFTPEFRNRLDEVIRFNPLSRETIMSVIDKFLIGLQRQLDDKKVHLKAGKAVKEYLAQKGYDPVMGARPMQRVIQQEIKKPLAEMILFGDLQDGGTVKATMKKGELRLTIV